MGAYPKIASARSAHRSSPYCVEFSRSHILTGPPLHKSTALALHGTVSPMSIARFKNVEELLGFAREFFDNRVETFQKDIAICRTPDARGQHAYFPALITCIAFAELLSGCNAGRLNGLKLKDLEQYAKDFMEPDYTDDPA